MIKKSFSIRNGRDEGRGIPIISSIIWCFFFSLRRIGFVRIYLNRQTSACGRTPAWKIKLIFFPFVEYILHSGQYFAHTFPSNCVVFNIIVLFYRRSNRIHVLNQIESTRITITIILIDNEVFLHLTHLSSQHHHVVSHHHHHYYYNNDRVVRNAMLEYCCAV